MENDYQGQLATKVEFTVPSDANLNDMCEQFSLYLKACGFSIPEGECLDFVPEDGYTDKGWDDFFDKKNNHSSTDKQWMNCSSIDDATPQDWNNAYKNVTVKYKEHD